MAIVINDFEIVADAPPPAASGAAQERGEEERQTPVRPQDIRAALRFERERAGRVWAH